jgi:hypothetical protein
MPRSRAPRLVDPEAGLHAAGEALCAIGGLPTAFEAEQAAAAVLGMWRRGPLRHPEDRAVFEDLLAVSLLGRPEAAGGLAALCALAPDAGHLANALACLRDLGGAALPRWAGDLGAARVVGAAEVRVREGRFDESLVVLRCTHADGPRHELVAFVDHAGGGWCKHLGLVWDGAFASEDLGAPRRELPPAAAAALVGRALTATRTRRGLRPGPDLWSLAPLADLRLRAAVDADGPRPIG